MDLNDVHARALKRFDDAVIPQQAQRTLAMAARRFADIPGAQWDGAWGEQQENAVKIEVNKVLRGVRKIENDYRQNRIVPDFRPAGKDAVEDTAETLDGIHRADDYHFKAQQGRDNAFSEAVRGGFGAYRLANVLADEEDKDSDDQRINPALIINDADQCVFFDPNSKFYDKSDARFAFVLVPMTPDAFDAEYDGAQAGWPDGITRPQYANWFMPDKVMTCEYYEVETTSETLIVLTHILSKEERRLWESEIEDAELEDMIVAGWEAKEQKRNRRRVHKYIMSGAEILEDLGRIAGNHIPIVPVYGNRTFVDGVEQFVGHVQPKMDAQRLYNIRVSRLAEIAALAPFERPIFTPGQMAGHEEMWKLGNIARHPYALVNPVIDPNSGQIVQTGPIGKVEPPSIPVVESALLEIANRDLVEDDQDGADQVKANVSEEAMDIAAARVDAKSGIYLDNMRQSVQREGEIYLGMVKEVYFQPGREVETMTEDGDDGMATLQEAYTDPKTGDHYIRNDFTSGKYKVMVAVTEATATKRDKAVRSSLSLAEIAQTVGDTELAQASLLTAVMNQDGEGMTSLQKFARKKGLQLGLVEPNKEEQAEMEQAAQDQAEKPDPAMEVAAAQVEALQATAEKDMSQAAKLDAEVDLTRAKTADIASRIGQVQPSSRGA